MLNGAPARHRAADLLFGDIRKNMKPKRTLDILIAAIAFAMCCSCGGGGNSSIITPSTVHASTPPCSIERFYDGPTETPDYLQFASQACLISENVLEHYT